MGTIPASTLQLRHSRPDPSVQAGSPPTEHPRQLWPRRTRLHRRPITQDRQIVFA
jgi:hypothetical protein